MKNERIRVFELAKELQVAIADIQFALQTMKLPTRQQSTGWISGRHADMIRRAKGGAWHPRKRQQAGTGALRMLTRPARQPRRVWLLCTCCETKFDTLVAEGQSRPSTCPECVPHQGQSEESVDRLDIHLGKTRAWADLLYRKNTEMDTERQDAFRTRNTWRRVLVELMQGHAPNKDEEKLDLCLCGQPYPCVTRELLASINPGISSQVERFEQMHPAQRDKELSGEPWTAEDEYAYREHLRRANGVDDQDWAS